MVLEFRKLVLTLLQQPHKRGAPPTLSARTPGLTFLGQDEDSLGELQEFLLSCAALITGCLLSTGLMISATRAGLVCFSEPQLFQLCFRADGHPPVTPTFKSKVAAYVSARAGLDTNLGSAPRNSLGQVCPKSVPQLGPSCRTRQGRRPGLEWPMQRPVSATAPTASSPASEADPQNLPTSMPQPCHLR